MYRQADKWVGYGIALLQAVSAAFNLVWVGMHGGISIEYGLGQTLGTLLLLVAGIKFAAGRLDGQILLCLLCLPVQIFYLTLSEFYSSPTLGTSFRVSVFVTLAVGLYALFRLVSRIWERAPATIDTDSR